MPRKPKYSRRKRVAKKPQPMSSADMAWTLAKRAWSGIQYVKQLVNSELYQHENSATGTCSTTGYITLLNNIAQGDGDGTRTGVSILQKGIYFSFRLRNSATTPEPATCVRVMLVVDQQQVSDTSPTLSQILEVTTPPYSILSPLNGNLGVNRFKKIYDQTFSLDTVTNVQKQVKQYIRAPMHVRFNGSGNADIEKNGLYLVIFNDTSVSTQPSFFYQARIYYHDN